MTRAVELFERLRRGGELAVDALIADYQSENLWLDFKRSADQGAGTKLHRSDRENLAKAIAGFGNADGGVIVWGVDCRRDPRTGADLPGDKFPVQQPHRFVSWLENVVSSCTSPFHNTVEHAALIPPGQSPGLVATLIPSSMLAPHQCIQPPEDLRYYTRAGSTFSAIPHAVLSGMFGRRPQPRITTKWLGPSVDAYSFQGITLTAVLALSNTGRSIARDLYANIFMMSPTQSYSSMTFAVSENPWDEYRLADNVVTVTSKEHFRLPPGAAIPVGQLKVHLQPPFPSSYVLDMSWGCEGTEREQFRIDITPEEVKDLCSRGVAIAKSVESREPIYKVFFGGQ